MKTEPTLEQLQLALRQLRRPHWPADLEACLARPQYAVPITCLARSLHRRRAVDAARRSPLQEATAGQPLPPDPTTPSRPRDDTVPAWRLSGKPMHHVRPGGDDCKRLAANDKD